MEPRRQAGAAIGGFTGGFTVTWTVVVTLVVVGGEGGLGDRRGGTGVLIGMVEGPGVAGVG